MRIVLGEITLDTANNAHITIKTDAQLFKSMHDQYCRIRKRRIFTWLYMPVNIQFVRFSFYDGGHVGIYERPMFLSSKGEVEAGNHHYQECPLTFYHLSTTGPSSTIFGTTKDTQTHEATSSSTDYQRS